MGSLHDIVSCVLGELGAVPGKKRVPGTAPGTGSDWFRGLDRFQGSEVRELVPGAIRWVALGSVPEVWTEPVLGQR